MKAAAPAAIVGEFPGGERVMRGPVRPGRVGYHQSMRRFSLICLWILTAFAAGACSPYRQQEPNFLREREDIHERLSELMVRDGFSHELRSERSELEHRDSFLIKLTLDAVKGRHHSLDKMLKDVGRICANPGYAHLPIRILVLNPDEDDRQFMLAILETAVRNSPNIAVSGIDSRTSELRIIVVHSGRGGS